MLPVPGGKWFQEMSVGQNMLNYDSLLTLTHFKGHTMGGFGGSNKNLGRWSHWQENDSQR